MNEQFSGNLKLIALQEVELVPRIVMTGPEETDTLLPDHELGNSDISLKYKMIINNLQAFSYTNLLPV